jgi:hypothetical protein
MEGAMRVFTTMAFAAYASATAVCAEDSLIFSLSEINCLVERAEELMQNNSLGDPLSLNRPLCQEAQVHEEEHGYFGSSGTTARVADLENPDKPYDHVMGDVSGVYVTTSHYGPREPTPYSNGDGQTPVVQIPLWIPRSDLRCFQRELVQGLSDQGSLETEFLLDPRDCTFTRVEASQ